MTDAEVVKACGSCHVSDDKRRMTRIWFRRATPENWELTIRRMMSLNNVQITPDVARRVIKSLSDSHGLAPEEARTIMFDAERRLIDFTYTADKGTHELCRRCHSIGRVLSERRTEGRMERPHRDAPLLLSGRRRGLGRLRRGGGPPVTADKARRREAEARRAAAAARTSTRWIWRSTIWLARSARFAGMDHLVGRDADAQAGRPVGAVRI